MKHDGTATGACCARNSVGESHDYTSLVVLRLDGEGGENVVSGTLSGPKMQPRLVEAMGFDLDVVPEKHMLFIRNEDQPGMISAWSRRSTACAPGATAAAISGRSRFIASVSQRGSTRAAPLPPLGQTAPKM